MTPNEGFAARSLRTIMAGSRRSLLNEANEFTACCLDEKRLPMKLSGAVQAVNIGAALQESMVSGAKIWFDTTGNRGSRAQL